MLNQIFGGKIKIGINNFFVLILLSLFIQCKKKDNHNTVEKIKDAKVAPPVIKDKFLNLLTSELKTPEKTVIYDTFQIKKIKIILPQISNMKFRSELDKDVAKTKKTILFNQEHLKVSYKIKFCSDKFVSILKESSLENSSPSDFLMYDSFNYLIFDDKIYSVDLSNDYLDYLQKNLWNLKDFNEYYSYVDKSVKLHDCLVFEKNTTYLYDIFSIKRFSEETLPIKISNGNFKFENLIN
jgi:hypothetical protein